MALRNRIGPYEILAPIGRGGAGTVFRVRLGENVAALKLLAGAKPEALARFEREVRLQSALGESAGFVPLLDAGDSPEGPYLVMPLLTGGTLRERLERGAMREEEAIALGALLAAALGRAHEHGIVHRDLKPENILFTAEGTPLVADLGLAKHFSQDGLGASQSVGLSRTGELRGTAGYMAPEQAQDAREVGPEADVFSLGAIVYECLTGTPAFAGESLIEVLGKVDSSEVVPLEKARPKTARWLRALIARALAHDPARRFHNGHELAAAFAARRDPGNPWVRRLGLATFAVVLLAGAGTGLAALLAESAAKRRTALAKETVEEGRAVELKGDLLGAEKAYTRAIEADPLYAYGWTQRGRVRARLGNPGGVIADCTRAIELDPNDSGPWGNRAWAKERNRDFDGAIADGTKAIELDPSIASLWHNRAQARSDKNDNEGALRDFTRATELDPHFKDAWICRGQTRLDMGDVDGAISDSTRGIECNLGFEGGWYARAVARAVKEDFEGALADYNKAIELEPRDLRAFVKRAEVRRRLRDYKGAIEDFTHVLELHPEEGPYWYGRGAAHELAREGPEALSDYEKALSLELPEAIRTGAADGIERIKKWQ